MAKKKKKKSKKIKKVLGKRKKKIKIKKTKKKKLKKKAKKSKKLKKSTVQSKKSAKISQTAVTELPWRTALPGEIFIGVVDDYYSHVGVVAAVLKNSVQIGDRIHVRGHTTDIIQPVTSMQIEHADVQSAAVGGSVGIKINQKVRKGDYIYKINI